MKKVIAILALGISSLIILINVILPDFHLSNGLFVLTIVILVVSYLYLKKE